jgi:crotonobetainyl-CoA:carnitine CoA-transferase CaiB-like acyl-CoA transferase
MKAKGYHDFTIDHHSAARTLPSPKGDAMPAPPASTALNGLTVIDLTRVRAGPTCVRQFADWGADVIKIEMRESEPIGTQNEFSTRHEPDFQNLHRNKRGITLNLKTKEGLDLLHRLVRRADVLIENFRPDVKFRLGIDYESLAAINPRLIYTSISGFGQDGPYKDRPGVDQIAQGLSGLMSITGEPGRGPMRTGISVADLSAGVFAALGTLIALQERQASGKGQWVQTSLLQAQIFMLDYQGARYVMSGEVPEQVGNGHPTGVPTGTYKTRDGYINVAPTPPMWRRFCAAIGRDDLASHPDYATAVKRRTRRAEIDDLIGRITSTASTAELVEKFNAAGIPCGPIYTVDQTFADPQVKHLGVTQPVTSKAMGAINLLAQPISLSRTPSRLTQAAPEYGEHTDEVLMELGYSADEIDTLRKKKVI